MTTDRIVRIRIGASVDSSVDQVFAQLATTVQRARDKMEQETTGSAERMARGDKAGAAKGAAGVKAGLDAQQKARERYEQWWFGQLQRMSAQEARAAKKSEALAKQTAKAAEAEATRQSNFAESQITKRRATEQRAVARSEAEANKSARNAEMLARRATALATSEANKRARDAAAAAKRAGAAEASEAAKAAAKIKHEMTGALTAVERASLTDTQKIARHFAMMSQAASREIHKIEGAEARAVARNSMGLPPGGGAPGAGGSGGGRGLGRFAGGYLALSVARGAASFAARTARSLASGVGVDLEIESHLQKQIKLRTTIQNLVNASYQEGANGPAGTRANTGEVREQVEKVAIDTGYATEAVAQGLYKFQEVTGNLQLGRDVLKDMAVMARATGSEVDDVVAASSELAKQLGDSPDAAERLHVVMGHIAGMGKIGAIEMKDMVTQMGKVAAIAPFMSTREGGTQAQQFDTNVVMAGAFSQIGRQQGLATNARESGTALVNLMNTFKTHARREAFENITHTKMESSPGVMRDWRELFKDALRAAGGNTEKWQAMFKDMRTGKISEGIRGHYLKAGGGEAGIRAFEESVDKFMKETVSAEATIKAFRASMATPEARIQVLNNELQKASDALLMGLVPAVSAASPALKEMADAIGGFALWMTGQTPGSEKREEKVAQLDEAAAQLQKQKLEGTVKDASIDNVQKLRTEARLQAEAMNPQIEAAMEKARDIADPLRIFRRNDAKARERVASGHVFEGLVDSTMNVAGVIPNAAFMKVNEALGGYDVDKRMPSKLQSEQKVSYAAAERANVILLEIKGLLAQNLLKREPIKPPGVKENGRASAVKTSGPAPTPAAPTPETDYSE